MTTQFFPVKYYPAEMGPQEWTEGYERGYRFYRYVGLYNHEKISGFEYVKGIAQDVLYPLGLAYEDDPEMEYVAVLQAIYIYPIALSAETFHSTLMFALETMKKSAAYTYIYAESLPGLDKKMANDLLKNFGFMKLRMKEEDEKRVWTGWLVSKNF